MIFLKLLLVLLLIICILQSHATRNKDQIKAFAGEIYKSYFKNIVNGCIFSKLYNERFLVDNILNFKNNVTTNERFSKNRKFIANLVSLPKFREMLDTDLKKVKKDYVEKIKYCLKK